MTNDSSTPYIIIYMFPMQRFLCGLVILLLFLTEYRVDKIVIVYFVPEYKFKQFSSLLTVSACFNHVLEYI